MAFMAPKPPKPTAAPKPANPAMDPLNAEALTDPGSAFATARSLISTSGRGLKRRASTQRTSLIGG